MLYIHRVKCLFHFTKYFVDFCFSYELSNASRIKKVLKNKDISYTPFQVETLRVSYHKVGVQQVYGMRKGVKRAPTALRSGGCADQQVYEIFNGVNETYGEK
jgi:hypothetical protein